MTAIFIEKMGTAARHEIRLKAEPELNDNVQNLVTAPATPGSYHTCSGNEGVSLSYHRIIYTKKPAVRLVLTFSVILQKPDYSPGQARGGSDDCILSASVHHNGFGMKLSARASSLYVQAVTKGCRVIGRFSYCFQHGEGIVNPTCCLCYAVLNFNSTVHYCNFIVYYILF